MLEADAPSAGPGDGGDGLAAFSGDTGVPTDYGVWPHQRVDGLQVEALVG